MANNSSKKKTNTNKKNNNNKKVSEVKNTNTTKKGNNKGVNNSAKKEVKKITPKEEVKKEKIVEEKVTKEVKKEKNKFKLTSKQKDIILVLLVVVILVIAMVLTGNKNKLDIELPIALEGEAGFTEITYTEYEEKLNTEAPFVVVIVQDGCSYCEKYEPVVTSVANKYSLPIYYINLANLTSEEYTALANSNSYLKNNQWGTPTTLFMYGDTVVDSIGGYIEEDAFTEFVRENFVVAENE